MPMWLRTLLAVGVAAATADTEGDREPQFLALVKAKVDEAHSTLHGGAQQGHQRRSDLDHRNPGGHEWGHSHGHEGGPFELLRHHDGEGRPAFAGMPERSRMHEQGPGPQGEGEQEHLGQGGDQGDRHRRVMKEAKACHQACGADESCHKECPKPFAHLAEKCRAHTAAKGCVADCQGTFSCHMHCLVEAPLSLRGTAHIVGHLACSTWCQGDSVCLAGCANRGARFEATCQRLAEVRQCHQQCSHGDFDCHRHCPKMQWGPGRPGPQLEAMGGNPLITM